MDISRTLPFELVRAVNDELEPDERLLWTAQPKLTAGTIRNLPVFMFAIPWTAFAVFWVVMAFVMTRDIPEEEPIAWFFGTLFPLFGLPFVAIGVGMLSTPYWRMRKNRQTVYAATNARILTINVGRTRKVSSCFLETLDGVERKENKDGSGDVLLQSHAGVDISLVGIGNVREVEQVIRELAASNKTSQFLSPSDDYAFDEDNDSEFDA